MAFAYEPLDSERPAFRLLRLCKGRTLPIQCELFCAYVGDDGDGIEYEALSYTWGSLEKPHTIEINGQQMRITNNLSEALWYLRPEYEDRIMWIDAICINRNDIQERGHQVGRMASIYEQARQVIFWLGTATVETDRAFDLMHEFELRVLNQCCVGWPLRDTRWQSLWADAKMRASLRHNDIAAHAHTNFGPLLNADWFNRVWIIQEVAKAQSARVACGTKSVTTRIFALVPSLIGVELTSHRQAVFDIMPGPSRISSWWLMNRDLYTLLQKFQGSKASDQRDMIFALHGISSDACDTRTIGADYSKSLEDTVHSTLTSLLGLDEMRISSRCLLRWDLPRFLSEFPSLRALCDAIVFRAISEQSKGTPFIESDLGISAIEYLDRPVSVNEARGEEGAQNDGWELFLDPSLISIEYLHQISTKNKLSTPLLWATQRCREDMVRVL